MRSRSEGCCDSRFDCWPRSRLLQHRKRFVKAKTSQWAGDGWEGMWKKTVIKQVLKLAPKSTALAYALKADDRFEGGSALEIDISNVGSDEPSGGTGKPEPARRGRQAGAKAAAKRAAEAAGEAEPTAEGQQSAQAPPPATSGQTPPAQPQDQGNLGGDDDPANWR